MRGTNMLRKFSLVAAAIALATSTLAFAPNSASAAETVIVVFDLDRAVAQSKVGKNISKQLETQINAVQKKADKSNADLKTEAGKLQEQRTLMAADALQVKVEELRLKQVGKQQEISAEMRSIQAGGNVAGREIKKIVDAELAVVAKKRKADIVLQRAAAFIVSPTVDITDEVVAQIDKKITSIKVTPVKEKPAQ